jgi:hypothetical protein
VTFLQLTLAALIAGAVFFAAGLRLGRWLGWEAGITEGAAIAFQLQLSDAERVRRTAALRQPPRGWDPYASGPDEAVPFPKYMTAPPAVTAEDIAPVVVPEPELTDTGELRRIKEKGEAIRAALIGGES